VLWSSLRQQHKNGVNTQCYDQYLNMVPMQDVVNTSGTCSFGVDFYAVGTKYKLVMTPHLPAKGPATGLATVACNTVSNNACVNWTISPNTAAANASRQPLRLCAQRKPGVLLASITTHFLSMWPTGKRRLRRTRKAKHVLRERAGALRTGRLMCHALYADVIFSEWIGNPDVGR
jgi:hypothetical protein